MKLKLIIVLVILTFVSGCYSTMNPAPLTSSNAKSYLKINFHDNFLFTAKRIKPRIDAQTGSRLMNQKTSNKPIPYRKIEMKLGRNENFEPDEVNFEEVLLYFAAIEAKKAKFSYLLSKGSAAERSGCSNPRPVALTTGSIIGNSYSATTTIGSTTACFKTTKQHFYAFNDIRFRDSERLVSNDKCNTEGIEGDQIRREPIKVLFDRIGKRKFVAGIYDEEFDVYVVENIITGLSNKIKNKGNYERHQDDNTSLRQIYCSQNSKPDLSDYKLE